jgi:PAS domain S-box-containing protein
VVVNSNSNINTLIKNQSHKLKLHKQDPQFDLSLIIRNSEETLLVINRDHKIIMCNHIVIENAKKFMGLDIEMGMSVFTMVKEEETERIKNILGRAFNGEKVEIEYSVDTPEGSVEYFNITYKPATNTNDEIDAVIIIANNITEKKKVYVAVSEAEQRWRFALEGSNQGVWDWNLETNEVYFSPSWRKMLGYGEDEIQNSYFEWQKLVHPDDKKIMEHHIAKHLLSENPYYETEHRLKAKDGIYRWILSRGMIISHSSVGKPSRMIGTHTDITERKKTEENYKLLFYTNPMPMWTYDRETLKFLNVNNAAIQHYGYTNEEFLRLTILDIQPEEDKEKLKHLIATRNSDSVLQHTNWRHIKKNGEIINVTITSQVLKDVKQAPCLVIAEDITEKKEAELKLRESEKKYRSLFKTSPLPSFIYDVNSLKFIEVNDAAIRHFGFSAKEFQQKTLLDIHIDKHHPSLIDAIQKSKGTAVSRIPSWKMINKKGDELIGEISASLIEYNDIEARLVVINDITDKIKAQQELEETNNRFQILNKATSDAVWDWDLLTNETKWGEGLHNLFGWTEQEAIIHQWENLIHPDDRSRILKSISAHIHDKSKKAWRSEYLFKKANGEYSYVLDRGYTIRNKEGVPVRMIGAMQDITQLKLKESELLQSNERFQFVVHATSDIMSDWDVKTGKVFLSENYHKVLGWELPANHIVDIETGLTRIYPDDIDRVRKGLEETLNNPGKSIWEEEFRYFKADGSIVYLRDRAFISRDEHGTAIRMVGALQDISHRKYQEELQSLELRVFEVSAIPGIHFHDVLKTFINGYENLHTGIQASICLLGLNDEVEILAPKLAKEHTRQLRYFIEKQKECLLTRQDIQKNIIISSVDSEDWKYGIDAANFYNWKVSWNVPVYHHQGDLLAFITVFLDQSRNPNEQEQSTLARLRNLLRILMVNYLSVEQIRVSNERYDNMLRATHDLVWDWNLETGTFYRNNEGLKKVYGIEDAKCIQNVYSWMERIHPGDHIKVQRVINDILHATDEDTFDVEYRFKRDDGEYAFIYDRGVIVRNKEGKPLRMIGAAQNVTDRKKLEQELLQQELDKQKFISQATIDTQEQERREIGKELHDNVNQVLTTTKLYLDLSLSSPDLKDELIRKSSKNIIYVINEIRQLSRSLMDPSIGDLGLLDSINDLVDNINITRKLHVSLSADSDLEKYLDESQKLMIFRVIQEAMNNTIKYAQATSVQLSIKNNSGSLELLIADDGKGFDIETVKKGAGLKNIQNRVYLTGGNLLIDSAPDKGCKIIINFPINNKSKI